MRASWKTILVLLLLILPALYYGLGTRQVSKIQEVRIAETAREMVATGEWLVPHYNGELRLQKPPLPYWTTAASYQIAGVNETAVRLPAVLFGILTALLLFAWVNKVSGITAAANTLLVLVASYIGLRYFRSGEADSLLLFFISAATLLGYRILQGSPNNLQVVLFYLALGFGFFTKGPAGIAVPLVTLAAFAALDKRLPAFKSCLNPLGIVLFMLAAFSWYAWVFWSMPDAAEHFFGNQVDETFIKGTHAKPVYWYIAHMLEFYMPWSFLLIPAGIWAYKNRPLPAPVRFALVWFAVVFVLLTATANKQMQYALLFAPSIAIFLGHYLQAASGGFARCNKIMFWLLCLAILGVVSYAFKKHEAAGLLNLAWPLIILVPLLAKRLIKAEAPSYAMLLAAGLTATAYLYAEQHLAQDVEKGQAQALMAQAKAHNPLYQYDDKDADPGDGAVSFYAGRVIQPLKDEAILEKLASGHEIWLVGKEQPELLNVLLQPQLSVGKMTLWKLTPAQ